MPGTKNCYAGKILRVDLSTGAITTEDFGAKYTDLFIGGRGVSSKLLYDEVPPEVAPFDAENLLIFSPGALHGTGVPAASRTTVATRSPLTTPADLRAEAVWATAVYSSS